MEDDTEPAAPSTAGVEPSLAPPLRPYRTLLFRSIALGAFGGVFGVVYLGLVETLTEWLWGDDWSTAGWFSGTAWNLGVPLVAGALIGLVYRWRRLPPRFPGFIDDLKQGEVDSRLAPWSVGIAVVSLVSGPSLGPEAPMGAAGGAAGTWLGRHRDADADEIRRLSFIGISGAFGGLLSTPIGGPLLAFELEHDQTSDYYYRSLVPGAIAGAVAFGIMWPIVGAPFGGLLAIADETFASWMLLVAAGLGVFGAVAGLVVGKLMVGSVALLRRLDDRPVRRGAVGGLVVGIITFTLPLTSFSGQSAAPRVLEDFGEIGVVTLLALALLKAVSLGASIGSGFFGGPIFPLFFIGAVLGMAVHLVFPAVPLAVAVGCVMAALGAAVALLPLSMAVLVAILIGSGLEVFAAVSLASVTAYAVRVAVARSQTPDLHKSVSTAPSRIR